MRYTLAVALVFAIGLCLSQVGELVSEDNEMLLYLGGLIFAALYLGTGPTRAATVTSLLILNLGRIHPAFRTGFKKFQYVISFGFICWSAIKLPAWLTGSAAKPGEPKNFTSVLTHRQILVEVWGPAYGEEHHLLRVNISNLRKRLESVSSHDYIVNEPGIGYRLNSPPDAKESN